MKMLSSSDRRIGFGSMQLIGPGHWAAPDSPEQAMQVLRDAVDPGVTHIDTADAYGPFTAEKYIRKALHPYSDGLVIATKGGLTRQGPNRWAPCGRAPFVPYAPLAAGALTMPGSLGQIAQDCGATPAQLALAWLLHRSPVITPIPGTSSSERLRENLAAHQIDLTREDMASSSQEQPRRTARRITGTDIGSEIESLHQLTTPGFKRDRFGVQGGT